MSKFILNEDIVFNEHSILIVSNNQLLSTSMAKKCYRIGLKTKRLKTISDIITKINKENFDLILIDSNVIGIENLHILKEIWETNSRKRKSIFWLNDIKDIPNEDLIKIAYYTDECLAYPITFSYFLGKISKHINKIKLENKILRQKEYYHQKKRELENNNRTQQYFASFLGHEIKSPINGIIGLTENLILTNLTEEQKFLAQNILISSNNLLRITDDIFDINSKEFEFISEKVNFKNLSVELESFFQSKINKKNLVLKIRVIGNSKLTAIGDQTRIKQVLINLINNAIKHTAQGEIKVNINLEEIKRNLKISFSVIDNGTGMNPQLLSKIMKQNKLQEDEDQEQKKHGLGLSICHDILLKMNGQLKVKSKEKHGSEFSFEIILPLYEETHNQKEKIEINNQKTNILIIDDNHLNNLIFKLTLEDLDYNIIEATKTENICEYIKTLAVDMIFIDYHLDDTDAVSLIKKISENKDVSLLPPIILLSADKSIMNNKFIDQSRFSDFLKKPYTKPDLIQKIEHWESVDYIDKHYLHSQFKTISSSSSNHDTKIIKKLMDLFADESLTNIKKLKNSNDPKQIYKIIHTLNNSAANIGATRLYRESSKLLNLDTNRNFEIKMNKEKIKKFVTILNKTIKTTRNVNLNYNQSHCIPLTKELQ